MKGDSIFTHLRLLLYVLDRLVEVHALVSRIEPVQRRAKGYLHPGRAIASWSFAEYLHVEHLPEVKVEAFLFLRF